eukprot:Phypoly_transcript_00694.p1 GENE.Phypoly_transcript_00694~~Phypoly_transcript_00694.p1  ORF type:complete len:823 (+),score=64.35 Phypoly_transcript_00694:319-2787(+)
MSSYETQEMQIITEENEHAITIDGAKRIEERNYVPAKSKRDASDCNGNGDLTESSCSCYPGFAGDTCEYCEGTMSVLLATQEICSISEGGAVSLTITGASDKQPFLYAMDSGEKKPNNAFSGVPAGTHQFQAYGLNGTCQFRTDKGQDNIVVNLTNLVHVVSSWQNNFECGIGAYAIINVTDTHNTGPFLYSLDGINFSQNNTLLGTFPGANTVTILDRFGCKQQATFSGDPGSLHATTRYIPTSVCSTPNIGHLEIDPNGGRASSYSIDNIHFQSDNTFNVSAGKYTGYVGDIMGCVVPTNTVEVVPIQPLGVTFDVQNFNCTGYIIQVYVTGGTGDLSMFFMGTNFTFNGNLSLKLALAPPDTVYSISDTNGCTYNGTFTLPPYTPVSAYCNVTLPQCFGQPFSVNIGARNGTPDYSYSKNGIDFYPTNGFDYDTEGNYTVYVRDSTQCAARAFCALIGVPEMNANVTTTMPSSCSALNGAINTTVTGGVVPYQYSLNGVNFQNSSTFDGLVPGRYLVTIIDFLHCSLSTFASVSSTDGLRLDYVVRPNTTSTGSIDLLPSAGSGTYITYYVDNIKSTSPHFPDVPVGNHNISVTDSNGCSFTIFDVIVNTPPAAYCGDLFCNAPETCATCPQDCHICNISSVHIVPLTDLDSIHSILVAWEPVSQNYSYSVRVFCEEFDAIFPTQNSSFLLTNLEAGSTYSIQVAGMVLPESFGAFSPVVNWTTSGPPSPPQLYLQQHGRDYFLISWKIPYDGRLPISYYKLALAQSKTAPIETKSTQDTSLYFGNLQPNTTYTILGWTQNIYFASINSSSFQFSTDPG